MNYYYLLCGFLLGFLVMLLIHLNMPYKPKHGNETPPEPKTQAPKYAAGSDIDDIRYHYNEPQQEIHCNDILKVLAKIFNFIVYFVFFAILFIYISYKIDTM